MVDKDFSEEGVLNCSTESNEIMNAEERNHEESNEVTEEDAFNTVWKKKKSNDIHQGDEFELLSGDLILRNVMVPVVQVTSFRIIQFLVHYQIRIRQDL